MAVSLSLLKKGGAAATAQELKKPEAEPTPAETAAVEEAANDTAATVSAEAPREQDGETVTVEVEKMSSKELDALVAENGIEVPETWKTFKVGEKRAWLNENLGGTADTSTAVEDAPAEEPTTVAKPKGKTKPSTAVATVAGKNVSKGQEILPPDELSDLVSSLEHLKENEAKQLVGRLAEETDFTWFKLGGVLALIQENSWFAPYNSWREYVEQEHGMDYRKALHWVDIYTRVVENKVPYEKIKHLGWTKLSIIARVLTGENYKEWVKLAENNKTLQLSEFVKNAKKSETPHALPTPEEGAIKTVTTKTFKVHDDQKETIEAAIAKAKSISGTEVDTVALEKICMDFLGTPAKPLDLVATMKKMGYEKALEAVGEAFPDINISVEVPETAAAA
jgi:hypothetical protein